MQIIPRVARISSIISLFVLLILINNYVSASSVAFNANSVCNINGIIKSVEYREAYEDPCVKDNSCPVGAYIPARPATYYLGIEIESLSCDPDDGKDAVLSYMAQFKLGAENNIAIYKNEVKNGDIFNPGDKISGAVKFITLQHTFVAYELEKSPKNISADNSVDKRNDIVNNNRQRSRALPFLFAGVLALIVLIIIIRFLINNNA